jgi:preprotein translocase subunit SecA
MIQFLRKLFDTSSKDVANVQPIVEQISSLESKFEAMSDDELRAMGPEFREKLQAGSTTEQILPEVYACVREVSRRTLAMRQFDVQMIGGIVLHQGRISEMRTGEGKTLVAVAPMVLNALTGKGAHLVTVNDYLARRDAVWMGPIYHMLGLTLGIVQGQGADSDELGGSFIYEPGYEHIDPRYMHLRPCSRREAYLCDLTYGTNHEFGFDYLRDNMAFDKSQLSMRELNYALIDEVDSILIDEARTPHIISGPSSEDVSVYSEINKIVTSMTPEEHYTFDKKSHSASFTEEGMDFLEETLGIENIATEPLLFHHAGALIKAHSLFEKNVHYVVRNGEVVIVDENTGRMMFGRRFSDGLHQALEAKEGVVVKNESQTVAVITFQNLFRMYNKLAGMTGTAKTEEDEFRKIYGLDVVAIPTHRDMIRKDNEDIVFKTMDAKFRGIAREILRVYIKQQPTLVGTRSIEMTEVVSQRLEAENLQKLVMTDFILDKTLNEKGTGALKKESEPLFKTPLPELDMQLIKTVLSGAGLPTDPFSTEIRDAFLSKHDLAGKEELYKESLGHGVPHNVLNAKFHEKEALIVSEAGRKGAVTIATNMAGRGVDILLGGRVQNDEIMRARERDEEDGGVIHEYDETFLSYRRGGSERAAPPLPLDDTERREAAEEVRKLGGLFILGTERHESRRIDNQLRGRAGRQGDPGESRFFVSLEDELWRIFNKNMMENPVLKAWPDMEEVRAKFISGMIQKTQERIENHFFEARKHILEYDDVLNAQREHVYGMRREILLGKSCRAEITQGIGEFIAETVESGRQMDIETGDISFDHDRVYERLNEMMPLVDHLSPSDFAAIPYGQEMVDRLTEVASTEYEEKRSRYGEEVFSELERQVMLRAVNDSWMEHLKMIDYIREGIGLRSYGQTDPLVAYKKETFDLFQHTVKQIRDQAVKLVFYAQIRTEEPEAMPESTGDSEMAMVALDDSGPKEIDVNSVDWSRVGRNQDCPCGSGKKFKQCHYPLLRAEGKI